MKGSFWVNPREKHQRMNFEFKNFMEKRSPSKWTKPIDTKERKKEGRERKKSDFKKKLI